MKTIWNKTIEGRQYWVQVKSNAMNLELVSDLVSELAGGGYAIDLPEKPEENADTLEELKSIFDEDELREIIAFSRALKKMNRRDLDDRNDNFYSIYYHELENIIYDPNPEGRQIRDILHRDGLEITICANIDADGISWQYSEHMQFYEGASFVEKQSFAEYRASGPPQFARVMDASKLQKIDDAARH